MFGLFKKKETRVPLNTPTQRLLKRLEEIEEADNTYQQLTILANLILEARTCKPICYDALEFLQPTSYYGDKMREAIEK